MKKLYKGFIYVYVNKTNGMKYVGQTVNIKQRHAAHLYKKTNVFFDNVLQKVGFDSFELHILEVFCCSHQTVRNKRLDDREIFWIKKLKTYWYDFPEKGYNLTKGGSSRKGYRKPNAKIYRDDFESQKEFEKAKYQIRKEALKEYQNTHRELFREYSRKYREKHKDELNKRRREQYKEKPKIKTEEQKQKAREAAKRYLEKHKNDLEFQQKRKEWSKKYREQHKDELNERSRKWRLENKEYCKEFDKNRYLKSKLEKEHEDNL